MYDGHMCLEVYFISLCKIVVMNLKNSLSSNLVLALVASEHIFSITAGDQLREESEVNDIIDYHLIPL